ncbi:hypothetical protein KC19_9G133700 [Ceratodon purpureus]|uniref:Uncharacterized protein n=1 Tax=Ceratodon purpureus TaxID=3225 RepID=A0A8T0GVW6_CERPU|nr:hypothetical protein KC19_9G133700 [Ceratodon purpureus]
MLEQLRPGRWRRLFDVFFLVGRGRHLIKVVETLFQSNRTKQRFNRTGLITEKNSLSQHTQLDAVTIHETVTRVSSFFSYTGKELVLYTLPLNNIKISQITTLSKYF